MSFLDLLGITAFLKRGEQLDRIEQKVDYLMAQVSVEQEALNEIGTQLDLLADGIQKIVDNPNIPLEAADLTVLTDPLNKIKNALPHPDQGLPGDQPQVNPLNR